MTTTRGVLYGIVRSSQLLAKFIFWFYIRAVFINEIYGYTRKDEDDMERRPAYRNTKMAYIHFVNGFGSSV